MLPAKKIEIENDIENKESNTGDNGRFSFRNAQHSQIGRSPSQPLHISGQFDCNTQTPELHDGTLDLNRQIKLTRIRQQYDLAMLRHAFRNFLTKNNKYDNEDDENENKNENNNKQLIDTLRSVSSSELNQLVSAVVRMHDDERELLGIKPPDEKDNEEQEYKYLEQLSVSQLIELCYKEGIAPPHLCKAQYKEEDSNNPSQEGPLGIPD